MELLIPVSKLMTQHSRHSHPINVELWRDTQSVICTDQEDVTYITH